MQRAIELDPHDAVSHYWLAVCVHSVGNCSEALRHYERALKINPNLIVARKKYARCFKDCAAYEEAVAAFQALLEIENDTEDLHLLGFTHHLAGRYELAIATFAQVLRAKPCVSDALVCCFFCPSLLCCPLAMQLSPATHHPTTMDAGSD